MKRPTSKPPQAGTFDADLPIGTRLMVGLAKIGMAMKGQAWSSAHGEGMTPTQAQILTVLHGRRQDGARLSAIAEELGVSAPTASDAGASLIAKKLVVRGRDEKDARAARFRLSQSGARVAARVGVWPDILRQAVGTLDPGEQATFLRALVKMIRTLQEAGEIPMQRMCVGCRYFQPNAHPEDAERPHHCAFVDAPFGNREIRLDCADQEPAAIEARNQQWAHWLAGAPDHQRL